MKPNETRAVLAKKLREANKARLRIGTAIASKFAVPRTDGGTGMRTLRADEITWENICEKVESAIAICREESMVGGRLLGRALEAESLHEVRK